MTLSIGSRLAAIALTLLALTGCVRVHADTSIGADDTFSQHIIVAYTDSVARQVTEQAGLNLGGLVGSVRDSKELADLQAKYPDQIEFSDYEDDDLKGIELTLTDLPLSDFNDAASQLTSSIGVTASIEHVGGEFIVNMAAGDAPGAGEASGDSPLAGFDVGSMGLGSTLGSLGNALDIRVSFTFPGLVTEASAGEINGNTVALNLGDILSGDDIRIVGGDATQVDWWPFIKLGLVIAAFASVIVAATLLVRQDKRRQRSNSLPAPITDADAGIRDEGHPQFPSDGEPPTTSR